MLLFLFLYTETDTYGIEKRILHNKHLSYIVVYILIHSVASVNAKYDDMDVKIGVSSHFIIVPIDLLGFTIHITCMAHPLLFAAKCER